MKNAIFHLSTCSTCQRIIKQLPNIDSVVLQDIKTVPITINQLEAMYELSGSYESLFSKRAMKYRSMGLNERHLSEEDFKRYIIQEYTFLKRPVAIISGDIFIGNSKKNVAALIEALS